tara:strand:+ start:25709 stop:26359 length:651 start_codon:yes stop_codon:yes gene_type:complete
MKKNVLILSEKLEDAGDISDTYSEAGGYNANIVYEANEALSKLLTSNIELLVYNVNQFTLNKLQSVLDLRDLGADFPVLTLAKDIDEAAYKSVAKIDAALILEKPYERTQLLELSSKMIHDKNSVSQRLYRRFPTDEKANISGENVPLFSADVLNLSKSGAKLKAPLSTQINTGDLVKIDFLLNGGERTHTKSSKVIWLSQDKDKNLLFFGVNFNS